MRWLMPLLLCAALPLQAAQETPRFAVYYTAGATAAQLEPYTLLVLDRERHPDLRPLKSRGKTLLAYLSVGESAHYRAFAPALKQRGLLLDATVNGQRAIDVRKPQWRAYIVETLMPDILLRGFDGVMLDTADTAIALEQKDPRRYAGMTEGVTALIRTLRLHYPDITIMLNRGFDILPNVAQNIDIVLAESIYTTQKNCAPSFSACEYALQPQAHYDSVSAMLKQLREKSPHLSIYTLDYWPEDDKDSIRRIYAAQRKQGFVPYVSSPELQRIVEEP